ncbi:MAG: hypothetical protein IPM42_16840 [Saprospiraceae bacterium]|nr:hypothetical protein [Saprospiraceae bacterium]
MGAYTVDIKILEIDDPTVFSDILLPLTNKMNLCKLALDRTEHAEKSYWTIAENNGNVRLWLELVLNRTAPHKYCYVDLPDGCGHDDDLFVNICCEVPDVKKLLTDDHSSYSHKENVINNIFRHREIEFQILTANDAKKDVNLICTPFIEIQNWDSKLNELVYAFAGIYPNKGSSKRIATAAIGDCINLSFKSKASDNWFNILTEAYKRGKIISLVKIGFAEYPENLTFSNFLDTYNK